MRIGGKEGEKHDVILISKKKNSDKNTPINILIFMHLPLPLHYQGSCRDATILYRGKRETFNFFGNRTKVLVKYSSR